MFLVLIAMIAHNIEHLQGFALAMGRHLQSVSKTSWYELTGIVGMVSDDREISHADLKLVRMRLKRMADIFPAVVLQREDALLDRMQELRSYKTRVSRERGKAYWFHYLRRPLLESESLSFDWQPAVHQSLLNRRVWKSNEIPKELSHFGQYQPHRLLTTQLLQSSSY